MHYDKRTDGYALLDWLADNDAHLTRADEGGWQVVRVENGDVLGRGSRPSDAIISAANNERSKTATQDRP